MARGFLSGLVVGTALSVCAVAVASYVAGPPVPPEVGVDVPAAGVPPPGSTGLSGPIPRQGEGNPLQPATPTVDTPSVDGDSALEEDATRPAGRPEAGDATAEVPEPAPGGQDGGVDVDDVAPVSPNRRVSGPVAPDEDRQAVIATEPPRPQGSDLAASGPGPGGESGLQVPDAEEAVTPPLAPKADSAVTGVGGTPSAPDAPGQVTSPSVPADPAPRPEMETDGPPSAQENADAPDLPETPGFDDAPTGEPAVGRVDVPGLGGAPEPEETPETDGDREVIVLPQTGSEEDEPGAPSIGTPATSLLDRNASNDGLLGDGASTPREGIASGSGVAGDRSALLRNAQPFDNPDGRPLMSIILVDTGQDLEESEVGLPALGSFHHPITFAVDTSLPDARERAAQYAAAGHEVMALVNLPPNLRAADTEVALTTLLARVPQAVAVLEGAGTGLQGSGEMSEQVRAILSDTGHGIVWQPNGLDSAQRLAARSGVASQTLFRDFDSADQTPVVIRRFFDQAAFKASQQGSVIMVGRIRPETISALIVWGLGDRVERVAVAPVSAVLMDGRDGE